MGYQRLGRGIAHTRPMRRALPETAVTPAKSVSADPKQMRGRANCSGQPTLAAVVLPPLASGHAPEPHASAFGSSDAPEPGSAAAHCKPSVSCSKPSSDGPTKPPSVPRALTHAVEVARSAAGCSCACRLHAGPKTMALLVLERATNKPADA